MIVLKCEACGGDCKPRPAYQVRWLKKRGGRAACSRKCVHRLNTGSGNGKAHPKGPRWQTVKSLIVAERGDKCQLCGWDRAPNDLCHVVDRADGGSDDPSNLILLCPNHHRLFDQLLLTKVELMQIGIGGY